jgi:hypothetical protein
MVNALVKKWYLESGFKRGPEGGFERGKLEDLFERLLCVEECETKVINHSFQFDLSAPQSPQHPVLYKVQLQPCLVQVSSERWGRVRRPHQEFPRDAYPPQVSSTFWLHLQVLPQRPSGSVREIHPIPFRDIDLVVGSRRPVTRPRRVVWPELRLMRTIAKFGDCSTFFFICTIHNVRRTLFH